MEDIITLQDVSLVYSSADTLSVKKIVKMLLHRQRRPKLRSEYQALHGISFSIQRGSVYGIIGRNGAGKSTLLRILSGAMSPTSGTVERRYRTINLLALGVGFTKDLTGYENIFLNGMILGFSRQEIQENLQEIISYSELGDFIYKPMKTYSSGMISRLAFSIGIHLKPDVLLVDEILSVGDARFQEKSFHSIREYIESENTTAVLVSHSMQQIRSLCERCIWIEKGELIAVGDTQAVTDAYDRVNRGELTLAQAKQMLNPGNPSDASDNPHRESASREPLPDAADPTPGQSAPMKSDAQIRPQEKPRLMHRAKRLCAKAGSYAGTLLHRAAAWLYRRLMPHPGVLQLCSRINRRLRLIRDPQRVLSETAAPRKTIPAGAVLPTASQLQVAAVVDEFTYNSFRFECRMLPVEPSNWKEIFKKNKIDLFFCESAWSGVDSQRRPWQGQVYASCNFPRENRRALLRILRYCRKHRIPTVFWNKEDPTHFEDKVHNFVDTALLFDHIFTTDDACVDRYRREYHHPSVHCLPFAAQPRLFNPIETRERTGEIIFAGSWYRQHEERSREMGKILDQIISQGLPLKIYDRYYGSADPNHVFPDRFRKYLHPALRHDEMDDAYKASLYALNINTVVDSDTMFARRVFELMCCNTLVLSNYSRGMERLFGNDVLFVDGESPISLEDVDRKRENCLYEVLRHHTYGARWRRVLQCIGYPYREDSHEVCFFYQVRNPDEAAAAVGHFNALPLPEKSAVLLVSAQTSSKDLRQILEQYQNRWIRVVSEHYCRTYQNALQLTAPYFVFADTQLAADFPEKALLHDVYLAGEAGIIQGESRYRFAEHEGFRNVLCPARLFDRAKQDFYTGKPSTHKVYVI